TSTVSLHLSHSTHPFLYYSPRDPRDLHSFPTRRSSDLQGPPPWPSESTRRSPATPSPLPTTRPPTRPPPRPLPRSAAPRSSRCTDRKSTRLNSSHVKISYAVFCLKKKKKKEHMKYRKNV